MPHITTISDAITLATRHYQAGQLQEAERLYEQILQAEPKHPQALYFLYAVSHQAGKHELAAQWMRRAMELAGNEARFYSNLGDVLVAAGKLDAAVGAFRKSLELAPDSPETLNSLGIVLKDQGQLDDAIVCYRRALELRPHFVPAINNLGLALSEQEKYDEAVVCFRRTVELSPHDFRAYYNLGNFFNDHSNGEDAAACYRRATELNPNFLGAHNNLGNALKMQWKLEDAAASYRRALVIQPDFAEAHNNLGNVLLDLEKPDEAVASLRRAVAYRPDFVEAHNNLGNAYSAQGKRDDAIACYTRALALNPNFVKARFNLGNEYLAQRKFLEAIACYQLAVEQKPDYVEAYVNQGNALKELGLFDAAIDIYQRALALTPDSVAALTNMAEAHCASANLDEALAGNKKALALEPHCAEAHWNQSLVYLLRGDFERGWPEYEWRWLCKDFPQRRFSQPAWNGEELAGKTILIYTEQGLGDTLQFSRYMRLLRARRAKIVLQCQPELLALLAEFPVDQLVGNGADLPPFDYYAPLLSLPRILGTVMENIPAEIPYLFASPSLVAIWREKLEMHSGFRIGIVWQGNPGFRNDRERSPPLSHFAPLAEVADIKLISLQKGVGIEQLESVRDRFCVVDFGDELDQCAGPFMDTAAIMMNLDLVVTSDTSTAHLAGALGVPVWVALSFVPDWRWLLERSDSPWYPTMRLFRQQSRGDWTGVFRSMKSAIGSAAGR